LDKIQKFKIGLDTFTTFYHNKSVSVSGVIRTAKPVTPELISAVFKCEYCGATIDIPQGGGKTKLLKPEACTNVSCEKKHEELRFKFLQEKSKFSDYQEVWLKPEYKTKLKLGKGQKVILKQTLVGAQEGENVKITGKLSFELKNRTNFAIPVVIASEVKRLK